VARIEERETGHALPRLFIEDVAGFVRGLYRIMWKVEIDDVVAARGVDLHSRQMGLPSSIKAYVMHGFLLVQVVEAYRNMSRPQNS
jgi:hypothetical protein